MYKTYTNNHLLEVNCGFHFTINNSVWDSTYFGQFYDKIKDSGFNEKIERKGIQVTIKEDKDSTKSRIASQEIEDQVIFKNSNEINTIPANSKVIADQSFTSSKPTQSASTHAPSKALARSQG